MKGPKHVYEVYIRTTPQKLWDAITSPAFTKQYFYGTAVESDWKRGSKVTHRQANGAAALEGVVVEADPPTRLVTTFAAVHEPKAKDDRPSRVTWEITKMGDVCKLVLTHDDFDAETHTFKMVGSGWNPVLSGLKTLLETGEPLAIPMGG